MSNQEQVTNEQVATAINLEVLAAGRTLDQYGEVGDTRDCLRANLCRVGNIPVEQAIKMAEEGMPSLSEGDEMVARSYVIELLGQGRSFKDYGFYGSELDAVQEIVFKTVGSNEGTSIAA